MEKNGFAISDRGIGGLDTSWIATWGSGSPVLGILVEFDALPGLGNDTVPKKALAKSGNTNGRGCGLVRDVITNTQPMIVCGQVYATAALLGSFSYAGLRHLGVPEIPAELVACLAAFLLRASAIIFDIRMGPPGEFIRIGKTDNHRKNEQERNIDDCQVKIEQNGET